MTPLPGLATRSLWNRRGTAVLTVSALAVSVLLLVGVESIRSGARESFARTISGTDLIVGARSGPLNLLLYSVFRVGEPTTNVSWASYQMVARHRDVAWTIPISLGDSYRGYRVVGTTGDYFRHYRYGDGLSLAFSAGSGFAESGEAVLGAEVARALALAVGAEITISHGIASAGFAEHAGQPLRIAGVLAPTGTPVDQAVHVSLDVLGEIHEDWAGGALAGPDRSRHPLDGDDPEDAMAEITARPPPVEITAFLVGMRYRNEVLRMQRALNEYSGEPLTAVIPGVALTELWQIVGVADRALFLVAACVVLAGLIGMVASILTSLRERRREMALLRAVGARPVHVFSLLLIEAGLLALSGAVIGVVLAHSLLAFAAPALGSRLGLFLAPAGPGAYDLLLAVAVTASAVIAALWPAWRAYRNSLADGLTIRT